MPGVVGLILLLVALLFVRPSWLGAVLLLLALLYVGHLLIAPEANWWVAGLVGVGLLLVGELSQWSFDSRLRGRYEGTMHGTRAAGITGLVALGAGAVFLSWLVVALPVAGGLGTLIVGMVAFVAIAAIVSFVALRPAPPSDR